MGVIKLCFCLICSVNKTLQRLDLGYNEIGDAGAASIADALAYGICIIFCSVNDKAILCYEKTFVWCHPIISDSYNY